MSYGTGGANVEDGDVALARLILVHVMWSAWKPEKGPDNYSSVIDAFLNASSSGSDNPGRVYLHQCHRSGDDEDVPWEQLATAYELPPKDGCQCPGVWFRFDAPNRIAPVFAARPEVSHQETDPLIHQVPDVHKVPDGDMFRTRIFMDADCYRSVLKCGGDADYWVVIDMRIQSVTDRSRLWHTSVSMWSHLPQSGHHCPPCLDRPRPRSLSAEHAYALMDEWRQSREELRRVAPLLDAEPLRVFGRSYLPPSFLTAVPGGDHRDTAAPDSGAELSVLREVSNAILFTQNYTSLPHALLKGGIEAFRRFVPGGDADIPRYLLIPDTRARIRDRKDVNMWYVTQEEAAGVVFLILTDLEAYAASELRGIDSRMRIRENHLRIYQGVAEQAGTLWDALARLLPGARGRQLEIVHRAIEMIHQTLLQGIAELDQLVRNIGEARSHIESTADEVADRFNRRLDHPPRNGETRTLCDSLRGGYFDRLRQHVSKDSSTAARVTESYRMLLETIGMAFDERRVREDDRLQRPAMYLAAAFGVLGLAGVAQATLPVPTVTGSIVLSLQVFLWVVSGIVIIAMAYQFWNLRSLGRVASRKFEKRYIKVRNFLADVSTDHLNHFQSEHPTGNPQYQEAWKKLDEELCKGFVEAWKITREDEEDTNADSVLQATPYDAEPLRNRVETWTLQTLMLTERPRDFSRYPLPHLTCLYRICTAKALRGWQAADEMPNADSAVGSAELEAALDPKGYRWLSRNEKRLIDYKEPEDMRAELFSSKVLIAGSTHA
jgi:hypothetical protein